MWGCEINGGVESLEDEEEGAKAAEEFNPDKKRVMSKTKKDFIVLQVFASFQ